MTLNADGSVLSTRGLTVRFGGIVAVDSVDFRAEPGEVIGLIGTNGAGKSTLLNAIGGFVPAQGSVELLGQDISSASPHIAEPAPDSAVPSKPPPCSPSSPSAKRCSSRSKPAPRRRFGGAPCGFRRRRRAERLKRAQAAELIDFLGLGRYADRFIAELSTGTRRIVELASVLAVAPRVICLDEPTAGVAQREAEAFGPLIKRVQQELDATLVVVEHDLPMILSLSDRVYCMESGAVIARGNTGRCSEQLARDRVVPRDRRTRDSTQQRVTRTDAQKPLTSSTGVRCRQSPIGLMFGSNWTSP